MMMILLYQAKAETLFKPMRKLLNTSLAQTEHIKVLLKYMPFCLKVLFVN